MSWDPPLYSSRVREGTSSVCELYERASSALSAGEATRARALYEQALALEPHSAQPHVGLGSCALEDDVERAKRDYRRALDIDPDCAGAHVGLGSALYRQRRFADSADHYQRAVRLRDDLADAHWGAATAFKELGDFGQMRAHAGRFLELAPESSLAEDARIMHGAHGLLGWLRLRFHSF